MSFFSEQDALLEYRMKTPYIPEIRDPDDASNAMDESETEGFAHDFL